MGSLYKCHFFPPLSTIKQSHVISLVMTFLGTKSKTMKRIQTLTWQSAKHDFAFHCPFLANKRIVNQCQHIICFMAPWIFNRFRIPDLPTYLYSRLVWAKPPIDLHLVFENSILKNQVPRTWILKATQAVRIQFEIDKKFSSSYSIFQRAMGWTLSAMSNLVFMWHSFPEIYMTDYEFRICIVENPVWAKKLVKMLSEGGFSFQYYHARVFTTFFDQFSFYRNNKGFMDIS